MKSTAKPLRFALLAGLFLILSQGIQCRKPADLDSETKPPAAVPPSKSPEQAVGSSAKSESTATDPPAESSAQQIEPAAQSEPATQSEPIDNTNSLSGGDATAQPDDQAAIAQGMAEGMAKDQQAKDQQAEDQQAENDRPMLPSKPTADEQADDAAKSEQPNMSATQQPSTDPEPEPEPEHKTAQQVISETFQPPPNATRLSQQSLLWVDRDNKRVYVDGYVAMTRGPLEMLACPEGTKQHESVIAAIAKSSEVHAALLSIGAMSGTTVRFLPEFVPPTGQRIRVWVCWRDNEGGFHVQDARQWIQDSDTGKALESDWVFAGSGFWKDPEDGREYYQADGGDMICVSNFSSAMLDISVPSTADADGLLFQPFEKNIPERNTPVRMVLVPIPLPTDEPPQSDAATIDAETPPSEQVFLPVNGKGDAFH